MNNKTF